MGQEVEPHFHFFLNLPYSSSMPHSVGFSELPFSVMSLTLIKSFYQKYQLINQFTTSAKDILLNTLCSIYHSIPSL